MLFLYFAEQLKLEFGCHHFKLDILPICTQIVNFLFLSCDNDLRTCKKYYKRQNTLCTNTNINTWGNSEILRQIIGTFGADLDGEEQKYHLF